MTDYKGKKVLVMGLAKSGLAAVKLLLKLGAEITVSEAKPPSSIEELDWLTKHGVRVVNQEKEIFEEDYFKAIKNPGINGNLWFVKRLKERFIPVITEIELAFEVAAPQHYVAVTGSNGKTTTATLIYRIINSVYPGITHLSGNIGIALCETVLENNLIENEGHYIILEISNFQLLDIENFRPEIAVIINLSADHLDFMGSEDAYYLSKTRVYKNMKDNDIFLYNADDALIKKYAEKVKINCKRKTFSLFDKNADFYADDRNIYAFDRAVFPLSIIKIVGRHNVQNVLVSTAAAYYCGAHFDCIAKAVSEFNGVEHRIEFVREKDGVKFYNDSKATNTDAALFALKSFSAPIILIAGGHEKGLSFEPLKSRLGGIKKVIAFGECGKRLIDELTGGEGILVGALPAAVEEAVKIAENGDVVLLSPTTSSFDQYKNFEERGKHFKNLVNSL